MYIKVIILAGAMLGFCLARLMYLNINTYSKGAAPGEWYWYQAGRYRIAIMMHLASVIPGGILLVCQFIPIIRKKALIFHRINGYVVVILLLLGCASGLMLARRSFGGHVSTQAGVGMLAIIVFGSLGMGYYNIKRLQIDQHRAWMLRAADILRRHHNGSPHHVPWRHHTTDDWELLRRNVLRRAFNLGWTWIVSGVLPAMLSRPTALLADRLLCLQTLVRTLHRLE